MSFLVNPFVFESGADPSITFSYDPENDDALPGGATFSRASIALYFDGTEYQSVTSGTIRDEHRATNGGPKGFIPEPLAINRLLRSNDISNASWTKQDVTPTDDATSPIGLNQWTIDPGTSTADHRFFTVYDTFADDASFYVITKAGTGQYYVLRDTVSDAAFGCFDLSGGSVTETGGTNSPDPRIRLLSNGWYKAELQTDAASSQAHVGVCLISDVSNPGGSGYSYTAANETILQAHAQAEITSYSTTPIETAGAIATRQPDVLDTGISIAAAFSALLDLTLPDNVGAGETITLLGPDTTAEDVLRVDESFNVIMDDGGTPTTVGTSSAGARIKVAYGRDGSGRSASLDGATAVTGGAPGAGHEGENFELGSRAGINQSRCIHHISELYDERLSDSVLEQKAT